MPLWVQIVGYMASICIPLSFLPQTIKIIMTKETQGLSIISYIIYLLGGMSFLTFGIITANYPIIICQAIGGIEGLIISCFIIYNLMHKKGKD